jgi:thiamine-monophosphate kinase
MLASGGRRRPGEFALIERYFRPLATDKGAFDLKDDAALLRPKAGKELVVTADIVVSGVHFLPDDPPASIARKALRVNLSDLAAKGADPVGYLVSLALPEDWTEGWVRGFAGGLAGDQAAYGVALLGGDTARSGNGVTIGITAIGSLPKGDMVLRTGARPGDAVFVSGTIGDGVLGLQIRQGKLSGKARGAKHLLDRYLHPQPRTALAPLLRRHASAAIDISDGLVGDLAHICDVSGVGAELEANLVPLSPAVRAALAADSSLLSAVLNGGDDYEIAATVPESSARAFSRDAQRAGVPVTRIGRIVRGTGPPVVMDAAGNAVRLTTGSHTHF